MRRRSPAHHNDPMPRGRKRITNNRNSPSASCQVFGKYELENERTTSSTVLATNTAATLCQPARMATNTNSPDVVQ